MNHLLLDLAPITERGWAAIREEATDALRHFLSARRLVAVEGPLGRQTASVDTGRLDPVADVGDGVEARQRRVHPLIDVRVPFEVRRDELEAADRGARDVGLDPVVEAARRLAAVEDRAVYDGLSAAGIDGLRAVSPHEPASFGDVLEMPEVVGHALGTLREAGVEGPYALVLGAARHEQAAGTIGPGGMPVLEQIETVLDGGPVVWAPDLDGGLVASLRGGDFALTLGEDASIGYLEHDRETVQLVLLESFAFRVFGPDAKVAIS